MTAIKLADAEVVGVSYTAYEAGCTLSLYIRKSGCTFDVKVPEAIHLEDWPEGSVVTLTLTKKGEDVDECPLRQLGDWQGAIDVGHDKWTSVAYSRTEHYGARVTIRQETRDRSLLFVQSEAPTIPEAAADAVRQLKEKGEL